eukprot:1083181-Pelagomonas_calceolata.AAC.5
MPPSLLAEEGRDTYTGYEADAGLPYSYHTPHPSQWYNDERPRKSHPAVRGRKQGSIKQRRGKEAFSALGQPRKRKA